MLIYTQYRAPVRHHLRLRLGTLLQHAWRRRTLMAALYQRLAQRMPNEEREIALLIMAEREAHRRHRYERMLKRLRLPLPQRPGLWERLWLQVLLRCHPRLALAWADWISRREDRAVNEMVYLLLAARPGRDA
jgi:hypothetical protein